VNGKEEGVKEKHSASCRHLCRKTQASLLSALPPLYQADEEKRKEEA